MKQNLSAMLISALLHAALFSWLFSVSQMTETDISSDGATILTASMFHQNIKANAQTSPPHNKVIVDAEDIQAEPKPIETQNQALQTISKKPVVDVVAIKKTNITAPKISKTKAKKKTIPSVKTATKTKPIIATKKVVPKKQIISKRQKPIQNTLADTKEWDSKKAISGSANNSPSKNTIAAIGSGNSIRKSYKTQLQQLIAANKHYPKRAKRRGKQGKVTLSFKVIHSGVITDIAIVKGTNSKDLNKAAIQSIQASSGKLPYPAGMSKKALTLVITLSFELS